MSVASNGVEADKPSYKSDISADGRWVVFESEATNLVPGGGGGHLQVYLHDRLAGMTTMVSSTAAGAFGNGDSRNAVISANGRYIAFQTRAPNLVADDNNSGDFDVLLLDRDKNGDGTHNDPEWHVVSRSAARVGTASGPSERPSISGNGGRVAFVSRATDLTDPPFDNDGGAQTFQAFFFDRNAGTVTPVSVRRDDAGEPCNGSVSTAAIAHDGHLVAFDSNADDLVVGDANDAWDVFRRDLAARTTIRVSISGGGAEGDDDSAGPSISREGNRIAFESLATNLVAGDENEWKDVFVRDARAGTTRLVSATPEGTPGDGESKRADLSLDGLWIAFESLATDLIDPHGERRLQVYLRDLARETTTAVSRASGDNLGSKASYDARVSGEGAFVTFSSDAPNLVGANDSGGPEDKNGHADTFVRDIDEDKDGLPNVWEARGIDLNFDRRIDLDLRALGCNPRHKDLLLEIDSMTWQRVHLGDAIDQVTAAFAAAPNTLVSNPDGVDGVNLIVLNDEMIADIPWPGSVADMWKEFHKVKQASFGTKADHLDANSEHILAAKRRVFRYCIFSRQILGSDISGYSEVAGNDFTVALGHRTWQKVRKDDVRIVSGTLMHEFGHSLGLRHGGDDHILFKPNFHSVMNYTWQMPVLPWRFGADPNKANYEASWRLDYSRRAFDHTLDEAALDETKGIGGDAGNWVPVGPLLKGRIFGRIEPEQGPVDFDRSGKPDNPRAAANINQIMLKEGWGVIHPPHEDWSKLRYALYGQTRRGDPAVVDHNFDKGPGSGDEPDGQLCLAWEHYDALNWTGWCLADYNADRSLDSRDVLAFLDGFQEMDPSTDFNGDGVINSLDILDFFNAFNAGCESPYSD